jgi:hypothetical protein
MSLENRKMGAADGEILPLPCAAYGEYGAAPVLVNEVRFTLGYFNKEFVTGRNWLLPVMEANQFSIYAAVASAAGRGVDLNE